ncbi:hypothetical protein RM780_02770 [Streptomyces sp. DSM 44917]|uniref:Uncharacterized protein n=1 Tax=Streptomyces boetiae TaxID=3075541 RepID=A0ABU2L2T6_9ACTN|nr:hypothetical protein [Streptomyces sp. DSM 44917]MDT0305886.1 hypothetical protein [Streptomyces sp. DSM 44917]
MQHYITQSQRRPETCNWCEGEGYRHYQFAYVPGPEPFAFPLAETQLRAGTCRNCKGSGVYDASLDPTLHASPPEH